MEPLMSNGSMQHREPKSEIDDTRDFLQQGASCTIAARRRAGHGRKYPIKGRQGFVPLSGTVGYGATVPRFRGGGSDPPRGTMFRNSGGVGRTPPGHHFA